MNLIPNKLYLAMNAALFIAYNGDESEPVAGSAIVEYCNLNKRALEPVLQTLSSQNIIISVKGAKGGYYMPMPESKTLSDVVRAFSIKSVPEKHRIAGYGDILDKTLNQTHDIWIKTLSNISFKQLCDQVRDSGNVGVLKAPILNYAI